MILFQGSVASTSVFRIFLLIEYVILNFADYHFTQLFFTQVLKNLPLVYEILNIRNDYFTNFYEGIIEFINSPPFNQSCFCNGVRCYCSQEIPDIGKGFE